MTRGSIELAPEILLGPESVTDHFAILARTDGGKTFRGLKLFEEMHGLGAQCVAIDVVGKWWSLRLAADGKSPGIDLPIFGGLHGDLPLEPTAGALVARVIVERGVSAVVDVSLFEDADCKRFVTAFARELYRLRQRDPLAMHLFIEEASTFCPQDREDGADNALLAAVKKIVRKGRNYGIGVTLIDQRAQDVNKKCLNQAEVLVVLGTSGTTDRKAIEAWIRDKHVDASGLDELASLAQGEAFVWIPRKKIFQKVGKVQRWTFDASATPKLGARRIERKLTQTDVSELLNLMKESVERAEASDPKKLQARVKQLTLDNADLVRMLDAERAKKVPAREKRVEVPAVSEAVLARVEKVVEKLDAVRDRAAQAQQVVVSEIGNLRAALVSARNGAPLSVARERVGLPTSVREQEVISKSVERRQVVQREASGNGVPNSHRRVLDAIGWFESIGISAPSRAAIGFVAKLKPTTGSFKNYLGTLRSNGFISYPSSDHVSLTDAGRKIARAADVTSVIDAALEVVKGPHRKILECVAAVYPKSLSREEVGAALGVSADTGSFKNYLGALRTLGVIDYPESGRVVATDILFPRASR